MLKEKKKENKNMSRPFIYTGTTLFISLVIFSYCNFTFATVVFAICSVFILPAFLLRKKHDIFLRLFTCLLSVIIASAAFSLKTATQYIPSQKLCTEDKAVISGTLTQYSKEYGNNYYYLKDISVNGSPVDLKIRINSEFHVSAETDDILTFTVNGIRTKSNDKSAMHYKAEEIYITAYSDSSVTVTQPENRSINYYLSLIRNFISERLQKNLGKEYAPTADAMITGNKSGIDKQTELSFSHAGISHLFAVSGFHLTFWTSAIFMLMKQTPLKNKCRVRAVISILFVIFFMALTGFSASVIRAGIMQIIMFSSFFSRYRPDPLNSLFAAVTILLLINPFAVTSMSLQMSFFATLGIITMSEPLDNTIKKLNNTVKLKSAAKLISCVYSLAMISVVATLFTVFISALNFSEYSVAAPITNILCIPVAQLVMPLGILSVIFSFIPAISHPLSIACNLIMRYIFGVCEKISESPHAVIDASSQTVIIAIIILTAFLIISLLCFFEKSRKLHTCIIIAAAGLTVLSVFSEINTANTHAVTVADVGDGMTILYNSGEQNIIIGCGGDDYSSYNAENLLSSVNESTVDLLIIPRNTESEASYANKFLSLGRFENIIMSEDFQSGTMKFINPDNTEFTDRSNIIIDDKTKLMYINNDSFSGVRIEAHDFECTIIFRPASDFGTVPASWLEGDLLVSRKRRPVADISGFENIFISTDIEYTYDDNSILTTEHSGQLVYRTSLIGENSVYADK